jgi:hypothetical protein
MVAGLGPGESPRSAEPLSLLSRRRDDRAFTGGHDFGTAPHGAPFKHALC